MNGVRSADAGVNGVWPALGSMACGRHWGQWRVTDTGVNCLWYARTGVNSVWSARGKLPKDCRHWGEWCAAISGLRTVNCLWLTGTGVNGV